jgi:hypothetical protein
VPHSVVDYSCGVHQYYDVVVRELHDWLPTLAHTFGTRPPVNFRYRNAEPSFSAWGWSFTADPRRAPEFLDVTDASCSGVTLTGSGTTTVTTGQCFPPGAPVTVGGANLIADRTGRVHFTADLGLPHSAQQYTVAGTAAELAGGATYWTTARVAFRTTATGRAPMRGMPV